MMKFRLPVVKKTDMAGVLAMEVLFFYTMTQMDYGLDLARYGSGFVIVFKVLTAVVSLIFAAISFAVLYYLIRHLLFNRYLTAAMFGCIALFLFTNVIYHRYFEMPLSLGVLYSVGNLPFAAGYAFALARPWDLVYPLCAGILFYSCFRHPPGRSESRMKTAMVLILVFFTASLMRTGVYVATLSVKHGSVRRSVGDTILNKTDFSIVATRYGFLTLLANNLMSARKHGGREPGADSRALYLASLKTPSGSISGPNVIMLQVESLDYQVLGRKVGGKEVTPFLNSMMSRSLFFTSFFAQHTGPGGTSDADFSSLTSFYPLAYKPSFYGRGLERLAALPFVMQQSGYSTAAFHANKAGFWGRSAAFERIGFDRFYSLRDFAGLPGRGTLVDDGPFLERTLEYLDEMEEPYYAFIVTMSSHGDYSRLNYVSENAIGREILVPGDRQTENYFRVINYVDKSLSGFYSQLVSQNKPFILLIYGDHTSGIRSDEYVSRSDYAERVPLFIITGQEHPPGVVDTPASQIDLPPTVLSMAGVPQPSDWQGIDLISQSRERLFLKNRRISIGAAGEVKFLSPLDPEWEETVFAIEKYIW